MVDPAPLPAKVLAAKTVFIQNDSGFVDIADKGVFATESVEVGDGRVVEMDEHADLVLVLTVTLEQTERTTPTHVSVCNCRRERGLQARRQRLRQTLGTTHK